MHTTPTRRRLAAGLITIGAALVAVAMFAPPAQAGGAPAVFPAGYDTYLNENQRGIGSGDVNAGACPTDAAVAGLTSWHFVLPGADHDFLTLDVAFTLNGVDVTRSYSLGTFDGSFNPLTEFISAPDGKHAYVFTLGAGGVVRDAAAHVTPDATLDKFQLSHVCVGETSTDDGGDDGGTTGRTDESDDTGTTDTGTTDTGTTDTGTTDTGTTDTGTTDAGTTDDVLSTTGNVDPTTGDVAPTQVAGAVVEPAATLPATGSNDRSLAIIGAALILIGGGTLLYRRGLFQS